MSEYKIKATETLELEARLEVPEGTTVAQVIERAKTDGDIGWKGPSLGLSNIRIYGGVTDALIWSETQVAPRRVPEGRMTKYTVYATVAFQCEVEVEAPTPALAFRAAAAVEAPWKRVEGTREGEPSPAILRLTRSTDEEREYELDGDALAELDDEGRRVELGHVAWIKRDLSMHTGDRYPLTDDAVIALLGRHPETKT